MTCDPVNRKNKWIDVVQDISPWCWTTYSEEGKEVHVLNLVIDPNTNHQKPKARPQLPAAGLLFSLSMFSVDMGASLALSSPCVSPALI
ncbi:hypothetical protein JZ751_012019 [Albula glossodonta]|uniref:Uncharacterized protein n=1 Tax=Albula glossodonta TaxID=121402 RepID=A0A8T2PRB1_9TELE|nr:hypothetical protein JZ751_012019 [Albula glossodonta]